MQKCLNNFTQKCQLQTMTKTATSNGASQNWWQTIKNNWQEKKLHRNPYNIVKTSWLCTYCQPSYWIAIFANICTPFKVDSDMNVICLRITHTQCGCNCIRVAHICMQILKLPFSNAYEEHLCFFVFFFQEKDLGSLALFLYFQLNFKVNLLGENSHHFRTP